MEEISRVQEELIEDVSSREIPRHVKWNKLVE